MELIAYGHAYCPIVCAWLLTAAMLIVIYLDMTQYIIPNPLNAAILVMYAFAAYFLHLPFLYSMLAAAPLLLLGLGLFALGLMGGGDVKLLTVLTLWTGWSAATGTFLLLTAIIGGVLCIVVLTLRGFARTMYTSDKPLPRIMTRRQPVPYGLAVGGGFLFMLLAGEVPALPRLF